MRARASADEYTRVLVAHHVERRRCGHRRDGVPEEPVRRQLCCLFFNAACDRAFRVPRAEVYDGRYVLPTLRWRWLIAPVLLVALAFSLDAAAQVTIMQYARQRPTPVNYGLPTIQGGFTFCRLRYERTRMQRKSGWW